MQYFLLILIQYPDMFQWKSARKIKVDGIWRVKFGPDLTPAGNG